MSDHFSGPRAIAGPAGDITDLYAFPSPERPGHLVLVLDVLPNATSDSHFSEAIVCRFRLPACHHRRRRASRGLSLRRGGPGAGLQLPFRGSAARRNRRGAGAGRLVRDAVWQETTRFRVNDEKGASSDGLRVYAGLRAEPFFLDLQALIESQKTERLAFKEVGTNAAIGFNVLSIVVEADCRPWLRSHGPLLGVVGETVVAGKLPIRIERFGRPEIKNVMLQMKQFDQVNRDLEVRDLYNLEDTFHMSKDYGGVYRARYAR